MPYDLIVINHRVVDGQQAATFLVRVKEISKARRGSCWICDSLSLP
jgi:pyruvate/2-oxoglutarate dehydrogenase complex dihydrolipoamide acyltransferase (E2) component